MLVRYVAVLSLFVLSVCTVELKILGTLIVPDSYFTIVAYSYIFNNKKLLLAHYRLLMHSVK